MQESQCIQPFQVTKAWARNFRSIAEISVELDSLTILIGPNAAGKSNVLDILRFIKDALRYDLEAAISLRHGPEAIRRQTEECQSSAMELGLTAIERGQPASYTLDYSLVLTLDTDGGFRVRQERVLVRPDTLEESFEFRVEDGILVYPDSHFAADNGLWSGPSDGHRDFNTSELGLLGTVRTGLRLGWGGLSGKEDIPRQVALALDRFLFCMRQSRFYRIAPNVLREPRRMGDANTLAEDASNLASVLRAMKGQDAGRFSTFKEALSLLIPGVTDLGVDAAGGYWVVRLKHGSGSRGTWLDLSQESDGTVRLLGFLVALYQTGNLPLVGIEEPELIVHPGGMAPLADLLHEASRRSQVIVTTHSPDLMDCLTGCRAVESLRIVERRDGVTVVGRVADSQAEAVRQHLFSPGELHRMGELETPREQAHE